MSESASNTTASTPPALYEFGPFRLDPVRRLLHLDGHVVALPARALDVLVVLVESRDRVLDKDELMRRVWQDTVVEENSLARAVSTLRKALGEAAGEHRYVVTFAGRGYRFVAPVREAAAETDLTADEAAATGDERAVPHPAAPIPRRVPTRWVVPTCGAILAIAVAGAAWVTHSVGAAAVESIAVLPFDNLSGDPEQLYLADGVTEALITELSTIRSLRVISRQSVMRYRASTQPLPEIARELGVDALVEGSAQRHGSRVRVTTQLLHGPSDRHLWAATFDREFADVLTMQAEIARAVARAVRAEVTVPEDAQLARAARVDPVAYDLYLRGRHLFHERALDPEGKKLRRSIRYLEQAIEKDPELAPAYAILSFAHRALSYRGLVAPSEAMPKAEAHARSALALDPSLSDAHSAMAMHHSVVEWDWAAADAEFRKAIALAPGDAHARALYATLLVALGRFEESVAQTEAGLRSDPFHGFLIENHVTAVAALGRGEEAVRRMRQAIDVDGAVPDALGWLYLQLGRDREALAQFERTGTEMGVALARARIGDPSAARALLARLDEHARTGYASPVERAGLHAALGERDEAFALLEEAYRERTPTLGVALRVFPELDPLRWDPRLANLRRRMGLP